MLRNNIRHPITEEPFKLLEDAQSVATDRIENFANILNLTYPLTKTALSAMEHLKVSALNKNHISRYTVYMIK